MPRYEVSKTLVADMTDEAIVAEARELRLHIQVVQSNLSKEQAWAKVRKTAETQKHLEWLANTRSLHGLLQVRYATIRAREKEINAHRHRKGGVNGKIRAGNSGSRF